MQNRICTHSVSVSSCRTGRRCLAQVRGACIDFCQGSVEPVWNARFSPLVPIAVPQVEEPVVSDAATGRSVTGSTAKLLTLFVLAAMCPIANHKPPEVTGRSHRTHGSNCQKSPCRVATWASLSHAVRLDTIFASTLLRSCLLLSAVPSKHAIALGEYGVPAASLCTLGKTLWPLVAHLSLCSFSNLNSLLLLSVSIPFHLHKLCLPRHHDPVPLAPWSLNRQVDCSINPSLPRLVETLQGFARNRTNQRSVPHLGLTFLASVSATARGPCGITPNQRTASVASGTRVRAASGRSSPLLRSHYSSLLHQVPPCTPHYRPCATLLHNRLQPTREATRRPPFAILLSTKSSIFITTSTHRHHRSAATSPSPLHRARRPT